MAFTSNRGAVPPTPTLPTGAQVASFDTYLEAQRAVDLLSDKEFEVQHTTIVGTDLRMVERITGRLSYPRVALAGAMTGAWFGLFVGLLFGLLTEGSIFVMLLPALIIGAAFGILFALVSYAFTGGKRDFTSSSQVVASKYALLCEPSRVGEVTRLLRAEGVRAGVGAGGPAGASPPGQPGPYGQAPDPWGQQPPVPQAPGPYGQPPGQPAPGQPAPRPQSPSPDGQQTGAHAAGSEQPPAGAGDEGAAAPSPPRSTPWQDEHGNPRYGQRLPAGTPEPQEQPEPREPRDPRESHGPRQTDGDGS